jgi:hypothetical protein
MTRRLLLLVLIALVSSRSASAQPVLDHLKCFTATRASWVRAPRERTVLAHGDAIPLTAFHGAAALRIFPSR